MKNLKHVRLKRQGKGADLCMCVCFVCVGLCLCVSVAVVGVEVGAVGGQFLAFGSVLETTGLRVKAVSQTAR